MNKLKEFLEKNNIKDIEKLQQKFERYFELIMEYNEKFNITAIRDREGIESKHFIDSLQGINFINGRVLDVGAGGGFPSIPLAIVKKECEFLLIDSLKKRTDFLETVKKELELENVQIMHMRIEDLKRKEYFDEVVARAVAPLNILYEYAIPFLKVGGILLAYKGSGYKEEIKDAEGASKKLNVKIKQVYEYTINIDENLQRNIIVAEKLRECDGIYPRGGNKPRLKPL